MYLIINVIGIGRNSGKTYVIEDLIKNLRERGYSVFTVKHIHTGQFDTPQKDTWRHLRAGAEGVIVVTPNEIIRIKKSISPSIKEAIKEISENVDIVLVEGFKKSEGPKIISAQTSEEVKHLVNQVKGIIAVSGPIFEKEGESDIVNLPVLDSQSLVSMIENMIFKSIIAKLPSLDCGQCGYEVCDEFAKAIAKKEVTIDMCLVLHKKEVMVTVNDKPVPLSGFPQNFIKKTIMGMMKSLKGVDEKIDSVTIKIKSSKQGGDVDV